LPPSNKQRLVGSPHDENILERLSLLVARHRAGDERAGRGIGAIVRDLRASAHRGDAWFRETAARIGMCRSALYARERLARCWSAAQYDRLLRRSGPVGARIHEAHLLALSRVTNAGRRGFLIERVLAEGLTVLDVKALIAADPEASAGVKAPRRLGATFQTRVDR
jgi:hypothetical protein